LGPEWFGKQTDGRRYEAAGPLDPVLHSEGVAGGIEVVVAGVPAACWGDAEGAGVGQVAPERELGVAPEMVGR
jgi:hypothetical protein